ncbi:MAG: hypothetical protein AAB658_16005 [Chloroflexota bacterium]|jgi:hypothetical protein
MSVMPTVVHEVSSVKARLIEALREKSPQTIDSLCALPDVSVAEVLLAVDLLSRSYTVVLERIGPCDYQLSLNRTGV